MANSRLTRWRLARWWTRFRAWLRARVRERITLTGWLFVLAVAMVALAAFLSANNLLFLLLAAMVATLMVSGFISRLGIAGLELDVQLPDHICALRSFPARVIVRNEKRWMPSFAIQLRGAEDSVFMGELYFPLISGQSEVAENMEVRFQRRGLHRQDSFQFASRFPFGFAERRAHVIMVRDVVVYPPLEPRHAFEELLRDIGDETASLLRGRGHDFYRIRPYQPPESARHVDWRATAHTSEVQVREFAQEESPLVVLTLDLGSDAADLEAFEHAVECSAYLAWRLAQNNARVRFRSQEIDLRVPVESDVYGILKYLALVEPKPQSATPFPIHEQCVQLVFTTRPHQLAEAGWSAGLIHDARLLPSDAARPGGTRAGQVQHHHR